MNDATDSKAMTIGDLVGICWRRRWTALLVGTLAAAVTIAVSWRIQPMYQAQAAITVSQLLVVGQEDGRAATQIADFRFINTEAERLLSSPILREVLSATGAGDEAPYAQVEDPVWLLRSRADFETDRSSLVIRISVNDESPERARRLLSGIIDVYRQRQADEQTTRDTQALDMLQQQIQQLEDTLVTSRRESSEIRRENNIVLADPDDNHITERLNELGRSVLQREQEISAHDAVAALVVETDQIEDDDRRISALLEIERILANPRVSDALAALEEAEDEYGALAAQLLPRHPELQRSERTVADARGRLRRAVDRAAETLDQERQRMAAALATERQQLDELNVQLNDYRGALATLAGLADRTASSEQLLQGLRMRQAQLSVASSPMLTRSVITEPPHTLPGPVNVKPTLFIALGLFVGLIAGAAAALGHELLDPRVRQLQPLATELGLRTIGYIPTARKLPTGPTIADFRTHPPALREAIRVLRSNLLLFDRERQLSRVVLCTSADAEDGKTTVAAHLALSLAAIGRQVLLLEGDLRQPVLRRMFAVEGKAGLHEVIDERIAEDMAIKVAPNLRLLTSGNRADLSEEPLHDPHLRQYYLKAAQRRYDHVIIDSPPIGEIADAYAFLDQATTILAVARYQHTHRQRLRRTLEDLLSTVECPVRLVLNGLPRRHLRRQLPVPAIVAATPPSDSSCSIPIQPSPATPGSGLHRPTPAPV